MSEYYDPDDLFFSPVCIVRYYSLWSLYNLTAGALVERDGHTLTFDTYEQALAELSSL